MIVYNTTFNIENDILAECIEYLKKSYIPRAAAKRISADTLSASYFTGRDGGCNQLFGSVPCKESGNAGVLDAVRRS